MSFYYNQYEAERRKYAQDLIDFDKKYARLFSGKPRTPENLEGISHEEFLEYVNRYISVLNLIQILVGFTRNSVALPVALVSTTVQVLSSILFISHTQTI